MTTTATERANRITEYVVAIYLTDRAYGGPEEGGWWYDTGEFSREHRTFVRRFMTRDAADEYRDKLNTMLDANENVGRRGVDSVLSDGVYRARVFERAPYQGAPRGWPVRRPRYE